MSLWTSAEAAAATGGRAQGSWAASGVSIDTRTIRLGDLFVALTAARDGHGFVAQALEKDKETRAIISADQSLPYGRVMRLIDVVKGQGIAKFALNIQKDAAPTPAASPAAP